MAKRVRTTLIGFVIAVFCLAFSVCLTEWGTAAKAESKTTFSVKAVQNDVADVVLDDLEDFRVVRDKEYDGTLLDTYSIKGSGKNVDAHVGSSFVFERVSVDMLGVSFYYAVETGFSDVGLRKILGIENAQGDAYDLGLVRGSGEGVAAHESEEAFAERVHAALLHEVMYGGVKDKKIKIVIPANVSYIDNFAFVNVFADKMASFGFSSYDRIIENYMASLDAPEEDREGVELIAKLMLRGELDEQTGEVTNYMDLPTIVDLQFAKDERGERALIGLQGDNVFGFCGINTLTIPKQLNDGGIFNDVQISELLFEPDADRTPKFITNSAKLTYIEIPENITTISGRAFRLAEVNDIKIVGNGKVFEGDAFDVSRIDDKFPSVYVDSLEQWLSFSFENESANPLYNGPVSSYPAGRLYFKNDSNGYDRVINVTVPNIAGTKIGDYAFINSEIESITVGGADSIGKGAFAKCRSLKQVKMTRVNSIGAGVFEHSAIEYAELPSGLRTVPARAFAYCENLTAVKFSDNSSIETIGTEAFGYCRKLAKVEIPQSVVTVGESAFNRCTELNEVTFAEGSKLEKLGVRSFGYCDRLTRVELPSGVKEINSGAFCLSGRYAAVGTTPSDLHIYVKGEIDKFDSYVFSQSNNTRATNAYIHCADHNVYNAFQAARSGSAEEPKMLVTYPVQVKYMYDGALVDSQSYDFGIAEAATLSDKSDNWYSDAEKTQAVTAEGLLSAIANGGAPIDDNGCIVLYAANISGFVVRADIVYDENTRYTLDDPIKFNDLLVDGSSKLTEDSTLAILSYTDAFGNATTIPSSVHAAGTYKISVDGDKTFDLVIARKTLDISDFDFMVASVGGQGVSQALESATLYLYADTDGNTYPSLTAVDDAELAYYSTVSVVRSFTRFRGEGASITLEMDCGAYLDLFEIAYSGEYSASSYGAYHADAAIAPHNNYVFTVTGGNFEARGITFTALADGSYEVGKNWYVLEMSNWLVTSSDATEDNYTLYSFGGAGVFGTAPNFAVPYAMFGDVAADKFGTSEDKLRLSLSFGNESIGSFDRSDYARYINAAMPAGNYELIVTFGIVGETNYFTRTFDYTVSQADLPEAEAAALHNALRGNDGNGSTFVFDWDNAMHLLGEDAVKSFDDLKNAVRSAMPDRKDTVWANSAYDGYYNKLDLKFNLNRMQSLDYFTENDLNGEAMKPVAPDKYVVYYLLDVSNFKPLVSDALSTVAYDAARREFKFNVVIVREIDIPVAATAVYNGGAQKADIASSEFYTVDAYDGFTEAGPHDVTLTLVNSEYYRWKGKQLGDATATVTFEITKAFNEFIEAPDVVRWVEGKFDKKENGFIGAAKFGTIAYVITDTDNNVLYDGARGIDKRASMKAGTYILKATVVGNDNYNGLTESFTIRILEKVGLPWWGVLLIVLGALLIAAAIIFILWKKGVFQILTEKIVVAIRTRASVDATIASVRAAKKMEEGKQSVADAKRRERIEQMRQKRAEERALPPEERAAQLEAKAQSEAEKAEKIRARSEALMAKAEKMRGSAQSDQPAAETEREAAATSDAQTPTEE